jgi:hypothetical protein
MKLFKEYLGEMTVKELKVLSKETDISDETERGRLYKEVIDNLKMSDYSETVDNIEDMVKDPKLRSLLSMGFGGELANYKLKIKEKILSVSSLIPTQSEIGFNETLEYITIAKNLDKCFSDPAIIKKPIVTFKNTFIIDGHHRWSEIYVTNPKANVKVINIDADISPIQMLKIVQATIGSNQGKLFSKDVQGKNLLTSSKNEIKKYIKDNITQDALEKLKKYYKDPIDDLVNNCEVLKINNQPIIKAPKRGEMPQTSKDSELFDDLKNGVTKL